MYIGAVARQAGCTPKAIRLYEQIGLLSEPARRGAYRVYTPHDVDVVRNIRVALSVGFKLSELRPLLARKRVTGRFPIEETLAAIEAKRTELKAQAQALAEQDRRLVELGREITVLFGPQAEACLP